MTAVERLEKWKRKHRTVLIVIDDGTGSSSGWDVTLRGHGREASACDSDRWPDLGDDPSVDPDPENKWGTFDLNAVIHLALDRWEQLEAPCQT